jgi:hypothetical protein
MKSRKAPLIIMIIGVGVLAASLLADVIGIGNDLGMGKYQISGTIVGAVIMFLGLALMKKST